MQSLSYIFFLILTTACTATASAQQINSDFDIELRSLVSTIPGSDIPRRITVDDKNNRSFVAFMGGSSIVVINNSACMKENDMVAYNPRHIVMDTSGQIFVSYNKLAKIVCIDAATGNTVFTASTAVQPGTIMLSKNHKFLFATCYSSDTAEVFKINDNGFSKVISRPAKAIL